jgi:dTDP-L-rhamnose 4-epimerase
VEVRVAERRVLVTGGAGFVGSHLVDALLARGDRVRVFDNLDPQVHGPTGKPAWLSRDAEFVLGDMRDAEAVARALRGRRRRLPPRRRGRRRAVNVPDRGLHGNEYSRYRLPSSGAGGQPPDRLDRLVVASSMSIYGEGRYVRPTGAAPPRGAPSSSSTSTIGSCAIPTASS